MTDYSYAQLETLWLNAGGSKATAPVAAAIGMAESGGNSDALNPNDNGGRQSSFGIWQISNGTHAPPSPNWANPAVNAQLAVAKWKAAGDRFTPWGTFTSGAYKNWLSSKTTPDPNVPGSPTALTAQTVAAGASDCLLGNPLGISLPLVGSISAGPACLFSRSNARAWIGAGLMLAGLPVMMAGLVVLGVAAGMRALGPAGQLAEKVGGTLMLVPGAEGVGAAISTAGRAAKNPAAEGRRQAAGRRREAASQERKAATGRRQWQRSIDRANREEDRETMARYRAQGGEPRENKGLELRGGVVRESPQQRTARKRREQGAARAAARRSAGQGRPASREEAGF